MSEKFELTGEQRRGLDIDRAMGMVAGAGSGKTFVLTERFVRHLEHAREKGYSAERALSSTVAMTYTRKAAAEMAERISKRCEELAKKHDDSFWHEVAIRISEANIGTIHSFCGKIVRKYPFMATINPFLEETGVKQDMIAEIASVFCNSIEEFGERMVEVYKAFADMVGESSLQKALAEAYGKRATAGGHVTDEKQVLEGWRSALAATAAKWKIESREEFAREIEVSIELAHELGGGDRLAAQVLPLEDEPYSIDDPLSFTAALKRISKLNFGCGQCGELKNRLKELRPKAREILPFIHNDLNEFDKENARATALFAELYRGFEDFADMELALEGAMDFDELLISAREIIGKDSFAEDVGEGIEAFLIDEFQDTDPVQWQIAARLGGFIGGNMFWVGDPKQSIYRFRGADVTNIVRGGRYIEEEKGGSVEQLSKNFRTTKEVLGFINHFGESVFPEETPMDFDFRAKPQSLVFGRDEARQLEGRIELIVKGGDDVPQEKLLATRLFAIVNGDAEGKGRLDVIEDNNLRPAKWGDIAVLVRTRKALPKLKRALLERDIPHIELSGKGFFGVEEITACRFLFQYLADQRDALSLVGLLRGPFFALSDTAILAAFYAGGEDIREGLRRAMVESIAGVDDEDALQLSRKALIIDELEKMARIAKPSAIFDRAFELTGAWATFSALRNGEQRIANLDKFAQLCAEHDSQGLAGFADYLRHYRDDDESEAPVEHEGTDAVKLMTIHHAKGLEFPIVCAFDLTRGGKNDSPELAWDPDFGALIRANRDKKKNDQGTAQSVMKTLDDAREDAEMRRLAYVAITRARDHLLLSSNTLSNKDNAPNAQGLMKFISPLLYEHDPESGCVDVDLNGVNVLIRKGIEGVGLPPAEMEDKHFPRIYQNFGTKKIDGRVNADLAPIIDEGEFFITATDLPSLGECPKRTALVAFSAESRIGGPRGKSWGTVVHEFLERMPSPLPSAEEIEGIAVQTCAHSGFPHGVESLLKIAQTRELQALFAETPMQDFRERRIVLRHGGLIIAGVIDRLWQDSQGWHILDYKSDAVVGEQRRVKLDHYASQLAVYRRAVSRAFEIPEDSIETGILFTHGTPEVLPIPEIDLDAVLLTAANLLSKKTAPANCGGCPNEHDCAILLSCAR